MAGPVGWLLIAYLGSLAVLFVASLWQLDDFSGEIVQDPGLQNFKELIETPVYRNIVLRTVLIAALVTITDVILAFPIAFYMAKVASPRMRALLVVAVLMPLWSSYLVKVYAWRIMLQNEGVVNWALDPFGLSGPGFGNVATWLVFSYLWLPFMVLPIYAGLERIPNSMLDASGDLGGRPWMTFRRVVLPLALPAVAAGSIFTFSLTLGDYIAPTLVSSTQFIGNVVYANVGIANNLPLAAAFATVPVAIMIVYLLIARRLGAFESALMHISNGVRWVLRIGTAITLAFIYVPLIVIAIYAFNKSRSQAWPVDGFTLEWFDRAVNNPGVRDAFWTSMKAALGATAIAVLLGMLAALAVSRYRFFGRETISFLIILPIALPGIVTGMALNSTFTQVLGIDLSLFTVIVGHATFCIVVVFNNAVARLRRSGTSLEEASMDLGANGWLTFRHVTFPTLRTALVAGALLAFALSLDEIIVTTFTIGNEQTLPIWIFANYARPNQLPIVNAVGLMVILLSIIPVYLANKLSQDPVGLTGTAPKAPGAAAGAR